MKEWHFGERPQLHLEMLMVRPAKVELFMKNREGYFFLPGPFFLPLGDQDLGGAG